MSKESELPPLEDIPNLRKFIFEISSSKQETKAQEAFPLEEELMYAASIICGDTIFSEGLEGLETARDVFVREIQARSEFGSTTFSRKRNEALAASFALLSKKITFLQENPFDTQEEMRELMEQYQIFTIAIRPEMGETLIAAELTRRKGEGFYKKNGDSLADWLGSIDDLPLGDNDQKE